jgi:hypothetical protein
MTSGKGQESQNRRGTTGLDCRVRTARLSSRERTAMTGQPEQDNPNGTIRTEQEEQVRRMGRQKGTGRTERQKSTDTTELPGQYYRGLKPGHDCWERQTVKDTQDMTAGKGQPEQDSQNKTARTK